MKIFLSYKFTGENPDELDVIINKLFESLKKSGNDLICTFFNNKFFKKNNFTNRQILEFALNELDKSDIYLAMIRSEQKSEGMLFEAGFAIARKKRFYVAIKKGLKTTFRQQMADKIIEYDDLEELYKKLETLKIK